MRNVAGRAATAGMTADPYPFYAELLAEQLFVADQQEGIWVAASAASVIAVTESPACTVRPAGEHVPHQLLGTTGADLYQQFVRMTDGVGHCPLKQAISAVLQALAVTAIAETSAGLAQLLQAEDPATLPALANRLAWHLPTRVVAQLLGFSPPEAAAVAPLVHAWVRGLAALDDPATLAATIAAGDDLLLRCRGLLTTRQPGLLADLALALQEQGLPDESLAIANGVGLLMQAYDGTAGLIGNALLLLAQRANWQAQLQAQPEQVVAFVWEVARYDPPAQHTRRFVATDCTLLKENLRKGEQVLVLWAAANRDLEHCVNPNQFDPTRTSTSRFAFGYGEHACPASVLAVTIAAAAVKTVFATGLDLAPLATQRIYLASGVGRLPYFGVPPMP